MTLRRRLVFLVLLVLDAVIACGGSPTPHEDKECTPGASSACSCVNGARGAQTCDDFGSYGDCVCASGTGGAGMGGSTSTGGATSGGQIGAGSSAGGSAQSGGSGQGGSSGQGGAPPVTLCQPACSTPADCAIMNAPANDADNYACRNGVCAYTGCLSDAECSVQNAGYLCRRTPFGEVMGCTKACSTPSDCSIGGGTYDADNYTCDSGGCTHHGCNSDAECNQDYPGRVCRPDRTGESSCWETCSTPADCTLASGAFDEDNFACQAGLCVYIGCHDDAECASAAGSYLCR